jgi:hypothetical protein
MFSTWRCILLVICCVSLAGCLAFPGGEKEEGPAEHQVLIASNPGEARVMMDGAELGTTPLELTVTEGAVVSVEKEGFEPEELVFGADVGPNVVVQLMAIPTPTSVPYTGPRYTTMRQIKIAYREGDISRVQYDEYKRQINQRRAVELEQAKADLRAGRLTEGKYKKKVRAIKAKYEG